MVDYNCFVDELELQATKTTRLVFFFFGVMIDTDQYYVEDETKEALGKGVGTKFHALKTYKKEVNKELCTRLTNIIIQSKAKLVCFPFEKEWLQTDTLRVLKDFKSQINGLRYTNYRSMAWLLFIHTMDNFLKEKCSGSTARIVADGDWLKPGHVVVHEGKKLKCIDSFISSKQTAMPLLALADHAGYLFYKLKQITDEQDGRLRFNGYNPNNYIHKNAVLLYEKLLSDNRFFTLDLNHWLNRQDGIE